jgi:hypothetical protein
MSHGQRNSGAGQGQPHAEATAPTRPPRERFDEWPVHLTPLLPDEAGELVVVPSEPAPTRRAGAVRRAAVAAGTRPVGWVARRVTPPDRSLMRDEAFRLWWLTRFACQIAQGALLYALLIIVVDRTDASIFSSLFIISSILPSLLFGLPGGIVGDSLPKRPLLIGLNLVRFLFLVPLIVREVTLPGIFAVTIGIWTIHQFYSPVESTSLTYLVPRQRLAEAQSLSNLSLSLSQGIGLVVLAPVLLKFGEPRVLFAAVAALYFVAAGFAVLLPKLEDPAGPAGGGSAPCAAPSWPAGGRSAAIASPSAPRSTTSWSASGSAR